jgi:hypothetical protein
MSYLGSKIERSICLEENLCQLKNEIEQDLKSLNQSKNHRVVDGNSGGCLVPSRAMPTVRKNNYLACCHPDLNSEEALKRALFNSGYLNGYKLIAQEAPFFRKRTDTENTEIPSRQLSCDLVGIKNSELCCIELKSNSNHECTQIPYALLEAYSYWVCANWIFQNRQQDFQSEISIANKRRPAGTLMEKSIENITFAVAFPQQYAVDHGSKSSLLIELVEKSFKKICPSAFAGYFILSGLVEKTDEIDGYYIPVLKKPLIIKKHKKASKFLK